MQNRELWKVIVLGIITLGIYDLYWVYKTRQEMVEKGAKIPPVILLFMPMLILFALMSLLLLFNSATGGPSADNAAGTGAVVNFVIILITALSVTAIIPLAIYWFYKYCKAVEAVTQGRTTFGFAFGMWALLGIFSVGFIWPALIQDGFNKVSPGTPEMPEPPYPSQTPAPTPPATPVQPY